jgi:RimJ/RimL family protein N-acetyltransferase
MMFLDEVNFPAGLELRHATMADAHAMWVLANDPAVRGNSFSTAPIVLERHLEWLEARLASKTSSLWVLDCGGALVAQIRYDCIDDERAEIDFAVAREHRGKGLGAKVLMATRQQALRELEVQRVTGTVIKGNSPSELTFQKAGFRQYGDEVAIDGRGCVIYEWRKP